MYRKELEELNKRLDEERNRYQVTSQDDSAISAMPHFSINDKFVLNQEDASYTLSLEVQSPIDYVLLQVRCLLLPYWQRSRHVSDPWLLLNHLVILDYVW